MSEPAHGSQHPEPTQVVWHTHHVSRAERERQKGQRGCVVWFTGLSGCGKSTVANEVDALLLARGAHAFLLDGDNVRHGLNASPEKLAAFGADHAARFGLTFSDLDRVENIRRIGAVAELFASAGLITLTAFISPFRRDRELARQQVDPEREGGFVEVFVDAPLEVCERRDPKGLYQQARAGRIKNFTGLDSPYEPPRDPEVHLQADGALTPRELAQQVVRYLVTNGLLDHGADAAQ